MIGVVLYSIIAIVSAWQFCKEIPDDINDKDDLPYFIALLFMSLFWPVSWLVVLLTVLTKLNERRPR